MKKIEIQKIAEEVKKELIGDESFAIEIMKEILALPISELGLQGPGSLYDFFRKEWQSEARCDS